MAIYVTALAATFVSSFLSFEAGHTFAGYLWVVSFLAVLLTVILEWGV